LSGSEKRAAQHVDSLTLHAIAEPKKIPHRIVQLGFGGVRDVV